MDTNTAYHWIMQELYKSATGLLPFTLYNRHGLMPSQIIQFCRDFHQLGYVEILPDNKIKLTPVGRKVSERLYWKSQRDSGWKESTSDYFKSMRRLDTVMPYEPYLPDKKVYQKLKGEGIPN